MILNMRLNRIFWSITAFFAFLSALCGILYPDSYVNVFPKDFLPGAFPQDVLMLLVSILLFVLAVTVGKDDVKKQIVIVGLTGSLFYLYGILTIERVYNGFYLFYVAAFSSAFWSIVYTLAGFRSERFSRMSIPRWMLNVTAISSLAIAALFTLLWTTALIPLMRDHNRIEFMYSIYILDLCFVMPAFVITAVMNLRRLPLGILMAPAIMILGFFVIFPLGLNELAKPGAGLTMNYGAMLMSFVFALFMLAVAVLHIRLIKLD